ncbi:disintegrin and metalloproteinase domain-containing protein 9-like [Alosa sapidissima]|uniref:disintegrin and metalloproteinase domain-containing protein 9-like n=1 Tax=Alosa sapidissima TaxID=34773 RepID=UPI001C091DF3|nr:disintegrin and metalloproteinase domain-containing protein 9-like [Alosa sapidissima]
MKQKDFVVLNKIFKLSVMGEKKSVWCYKIFSIALIFDLVNCNNGSAFQQTSRFSAYEVTVPKRIARQRRDLDNQDTGEVTYTIQAQGKEHVVILERNNVLLPWNFTVYTYGKDGSLITERPDMQNHCHYRGYVEDVEFSSASVSLCSGLSGFLMVGNTTLGIEPLEGSSGFEHVVYRLEDEETEPVTCGTPHTHHPSDSDISSKAQNIGHSHSGMSGDPVSHLLRRRRAIMQQTHYVELIIVVDYNGFKVMDNETRVQDQMIQVANRLDSMYAPLNIRVVLVGLEIWTAGNLITVDRNAGGVLSRFREWRAQNLLPRHRHDAGHFVAKQHFGNIAGLAYVSTVCSQLSAAINIYGSVGYLSSIMSHELGHNLGMGHDRPGCHCPAKQCRMGAKGTCGDSCVDIVFSDCSADSFEKLMLKMGHHNCLLNVPQPHKTYRKPYCGNKLLDPGEECDCGSEEECKKDPCCEPNTCKLKSWAQCTDGECCRNCKFLPGGYECRSRSDECDLPEYCSGSSPFCPADVFVQNGHVCRNNQSYCYNGDCQHHDTQCKTLFGSKARSAADVCYEFVNSKGDRFGNCGGNRGCSARDAKCGKLQCENVHSDTVFDTEPSIISTTIGKNKCWGVDFMMGPDVLDPGMVNDGTKCGEDKVCLNNKCKDVSELQFDCDMKDKCHGHGVCNNNKNCHCDYGWAPPFCKEEGYGGSLDSGPTWNDKDKATRVGLLIYFFLVLPLLLLGMTVFIGWNQLQQHFCRNRTECRQQTNNQNSASQAGNPTTDGVVQTSMLAFVPSYGPSNPQSQYKPHTVATHMRPQRLPPPLPPPCV